VKPRLWTKPQAWTQDELDALVNKMEEMGYFSDVESEPASASKMDTELEAVRDRLHQSAEPTPTKRMAIIKAGQIFVLTSGEWSDYRLRGVFRALKDIDPEDREQWPALEEPYSCDMAAKLVQEGFAEELIFTEWQCSTY
jgi:hypothetical protein